MPTPVKQNISFTKSGASFSSVKEALTQLNTDVSEAAANSALIKKVHKEGKCTSVFELVNAETYKIVRSWGDWIDYEEYKEERRQESSGQYWTDLSHAGWVVTESLEAIE